MLKIAVCDDSDSSRKIIKELVDELCVKLSINYNLFEYSSGESFLFADSGNYDIIFLDIEMKELSGIETAVKIRETDEEVSIIFMTNYLQYAIEGYKVHAYRYLLKPVSQQAFNKECSDLFISLNNKQKSVLNIKNDEGYFSLLTKNILYLETTTSKNVLIHSEQKNIIGYTSIKKMEEELVSMHFFRCHTSYLVNMDFIMEIQKASIILKNGETIPLSKHRRKQFIQAYCSYMGDIL